LAARRGPCGEGLGIPPHLPDWLNRLGPSEGVCGPAAQNVRRDTQPLATRTPPKLPKVSGFRGGNSFRGTEALCNLDPVTSNPSIEVELSVPIERKAQPLLGGPGIEGATAVRLSARRSRPPPARRLRRGRAPLRRHLRVARSGAGDRAAAAARRNAGCSSPRRSSVISPPAAGHDARRDHRLLRAARRSPPCKVPRSGARRRFIAADEPFGVDRNFPVLAFANLLPTSAESPPTYRGERGTQLVGANRRHQPRSAALSARARQLTP
jgi:hypothetical protein